MRSHRQAVTSVRTKVTLGVAVAIVSTLTALDLGRAPDEQRAARIVLAGIHAYQKTVSPLLGFTCRLTPTCSRYANAVITEFGLATGSWLALRRVARCGPWTPLGTVDPPERAGARDAVH